MNVTVVFDGYSNNPSTKDITHIRRTKGKVGQPVLFTGETVFRSKKDDFLLNLENKQRFLHLLADKMNAIGLEAKQAEGDADVLIAKTGLEKSQAMPTAVIGEDTDLLILLIHYSNRDIPKFDLFFKSDKIVRNPRLWKLKNVITILGREVCNAILLIHAILGCDTTSRVFSLGKGLALTRCVKDQEFCSDMMLFVDPSVTKLQVEITGERLLLKLYGAKNEDSLDVLRVVQFHQKLASNDKVVKPENLQHLQLQLFIPSEFIIKYSVGTVEMTSIHWTGDGRRGMEDCSLFIRLRSQLL